MRPRFALFWTSRGCSTVAFHVLGVAIGWQLYALTGDPLDLGLVGLAQFVPMLLLSLAVGQVADRFERRIVASVVLWMTLFPQIRKIGILER